MNVLNRPDRLGLLVNMGTALGSVLLTNALIAWANPQEMSSYRASSLTPPGYVIGIVWTALFLLMAVSRWLLVKQSPATPPPASGSIVWLAILCLVYPLYTDGLRNQWIGLAGNIATFFFTLWAIRQCLHRSRAAALAVSPVAIWLLYATAALFQQVRG